MITLATPHRSIGEANHAGTILRFFGGDTSHLTPELEARIAQRPPVPTTSIYSEADGVVCWRGCLEEPGAGIENIAVETSHLGMASHPDVLRIVAQKLALPESKLRRRRAVRPASGPSRPRK